MTRHTADADIGTPVEMKEVAKFTDRVWFSVDNIKGIREVSNHFEALISWKGYSSSSDSWEPLAVMYEDVPSKFRQFFKRRMTPTLRRAKTSLGL